MCLGEQYILDEKNDKYGRKVFMNRDGTYILTYYTAQAIETIEKTEKMVLDGKKEAFFSPLYKVFLSQYNNANILQSTFSFAGIPFDDFVPYTLWQANLKHEIKVPSYFVCIGRYGYDHSKVFLNPKNEHIIWYSSNKAGKKVAEEDADKRWDSIWQFFEKEIKRLDGFAQTNFEQRYATSKETLPGNSDS